MCTFLVFISILFSFSLLSNPPIEGGKVFKEGDPEVLRFIHKIELQANESVDSDATGSYLEIENNWLITSAHLMVKQPFLIPIKRLKKNFVKREADKELIIYQANDFSVSLKQNHQMKAERIIIAPEFLKISRTIVKKINEANNLVYELSEFISEVIEKKHKSKQEVRDKFRTVHEEYYALKEQIYKLGIIGHKNDIALLETTPLAGVKSELVSAKKWPVLVEENYDLEKGDTLIFGGYGNNKVIIQEDGSEKTEGLGTFRWGEFLYQTVLDTSHDNDSKYAKLFNLNFKEGKTFVSRAHRYINLVDRDESGSFILDTNQQAAGAQGDSGGGVFHLNQKGEYVLVGLNTGIVNARYTAVIGYYYGEKDYEF